VLWFPPPTTPMLIEVKLYLAAAATKKTNCFSTRALSCTFGEGSNILFSRIYSIHICRK
jgi:ribosomal protein S24E